MPRAEPPKIKKGQDTHARIVERAMTLASQVGLDGLTLGMLSADLGLSKSGLFAHFLSKEKLQLDVIDAAAEHFRNAVFLPALGKSRGLPRLEAIFENWLTWVRAKELPGGCIFLAGASEWDDREGPVRDKLVSWFNALHTGLTRAVELAISEGHFELDVDAEQFAYDLHAVVMKYHLDARLLRSKQAPHRARDSFRRLVEAARGTKRRA